MFGPDGRQITVSLDEQAGHQASRERSQPQGALATALLADTLALVQSRPEIQGMPLAV